MIKPCTHCGGTGEEPSDIDWLRREVQRRSGALIGRDKVREDMASELTGIPKNTLRHWRTYRPDHLPFERDAAGRVLYNLIHLCPFMGDE